MTLSTNTSDATRTLKQLQEQHREIIRQAVDGRPVHAIAEDLRLHPNSVSRILNSPIVQAELGRAQELADNRMTQLQEQKTLTARDILEDGALDASRTMRSLLSSTSQAIQFKAAADILDRAGCPKVTKTSSTDLGLQVIISPELAERLQRATRESFGRDYNLPVVEAEAKAESRQEPRQEPHLASSSDSSPEISQTEQGSEGPLDVQAERTTSGGWKLTFRDSNESHESHESSTRLSSLPALEATDDSESPRHDALSTLELRAPREPEIRSVDERARNLRPLSNQSVESRETRQDARSSRELEEASPTGTGPLVQRTVQEAFQVLARTKS